MFTGIYPSPWTRILAALLTFAGCSAAPISNPIANRAPPPAISPGERWDPVAGDDIDAYFRTNTEGGL